MNLMIQYILYQYFLLDSSIPICEMLEWTWVPVYIYLDYSIQKGGQISPTTEIKILTHLTSAQDQIVVNGFHG